MSFEDEVYKNYFSIFPRLSLEGCPKFKWSEIYDKENKKFTLVGVLIIAMATQIFLDKGLVIDIRDIIDYDK